MSFSQTAADAAISTLNGFARLFGPRFYRRYLDEVGRRFGETRRPVPQEIDGRAVTFGAPNEESRKRAANLFREAPATLEWIDGFAEDAVFWDMGAGLGLYSVYAAVARKARVVAFEAAPANVAVLARNVRVNRLGGLLTIAPVALAAERGISGLSLESDEPGEALVRLRSDRSDTKRMIAGLAFPADGFLRDFAADVPAHIRIAAHGDEATILAGAAGILADTRLLSLVIEVDDRGPAAEATDAVLAAAGFKRVGTFRSPLAKAPRMAGLHYERA